MNCVDDMLVMGVGYLVMRSAFFLSSHPGSVTDMLGVGVVPATTPTSEELYQVCLFLSEWHESLMMFL